MKRTPQRSPMFRTMFLFVLFSKTRRYRSFSSSSSSVRSLSGVQSLQTLLKSGFTPTLKSVNRFLAFLSQAHRYNSIIHFFSQLKSNQINGNSHTYSILTWALLRLRKFEEAEYLMNSHMAKDSCFAKGRLWDSLIQGYCVLQNDPERALVVLKDCLRNHGILPSSSTFCSLIHSFSSEGSMNRAIEVLELMNDEKITYPFDNFVCSSVISGFCKIGKPELALGFFENALSSGAFRPNIATYTALLSALSMLGRLNEVFDLVSRLEKEALAFDVVFYSCLISGFLREPGLMKAIRKHQEMVDRGINPDVISYTILIDGFSKKGHVEKAVGFLRKMMKDGVKPNVVTYTAIILGFCRKGKLEEAFSLFKKVEDMGIQADEFMYATLIDGVCTRGDLDLVFHLLDEMEKKGIMPSIVTYNTVINGLCKAERTSEADKVFNGVHGDVVTYSTLLHGYIREENVKGILETKTKLEEARLCMDVVSCNILIKAQFMVGAFEDAYALYQAMPEMNLDPDSITYCTMIEGYCKVDRIEDALEVFDEFRSKSISSVACYNCILNGLCKRGMVDMAADVFLELEQRGFDLDVGIYIMLIKETFAQRGAQGIIDLVFRLKNFRSDVYDIICNDAICFLCKRGFPEDASEVYMEMRRNGSVVTCKSYYSVLQNLIHDGKKGLIGPFLSSFVKEYGLAEPLVGRILVFYLCLKNVNSVPLFLKKIKEQTSIVSFPVTVFKTLVKDGRELDAYRLVMLAGDNLPAMDVVDYSILVNGLCKGGYLSQALDLCAFARNKGITLNIVSYNTVIDGLCRQGCLVEAFRLFDSLERIDLTPSEITYAILIDNLCKQGLLIDARQLFDGMLQKGCMPSTRVYNSLIDNYCKYGKMDEAFKLLSDLEIKGLKPDEFTVSAMINGYCTKGDLEGALEFFYEFEMKDMPPDFLGFIHMIRGLFIKGRMEEARSILREMLQSKSVLELINRVDTEVESESVESFLLFLCEQGSIHEALIVLNEIGSMFFPVQRWSSSYQGSRTPVERIECETNTTTASGSVRSNPESGLDHGLYNMNKVGELVGKYDFGAKNCQLLDFGFFYSLISSLCSKGELQKANEIVNEAVSSWHEDD